MILVSEVKIHSDFQVYELLKERQDSRSSSLWQDEAKLRLYVIEVEVSLPCRWDFPMRHAPITSMRRVLPTVYSTICKGIEEIMIAKRCERRKVRQVGEVAR